MSVPLEQLTANPYAPPERATTPVEDAVDPSALAGRGARLLASILDGLLVGLPLLYLSTVDETTITDTEATVFGVLLLALFVLLVVQCMLLHRRGQTIGKLACKVRIVRSDGRRAGLARILFLRIGVLAALRFVPYAGNIVPLWDALMIFRKDRRCVHDLVADTIVVSTRPATNNEPSEPPVLPQEIAATQFPAS